MPSNQFIKRIIKEETKPLIEQRLDDPNSFTSGVPDVTFTGLAEYFPEYKGRDMDISYLDCSVNWRYELELRSWGIKNISIFTTSVLIKATIEIFDEDYTKVETEKEIEILVDDMGGFGGEKEGTWYYEDMQEDEMRNHSIFPAELEVDLSDQSVAVIWN
tara:strand:- start:180 stop:659 length:480 start_codon:yes stop_codon:yes gene_type:complete